MLRVLLLVSLIALPLPSRAEMGRSEPVAGVTIIRGPAISPGPAWRCAAREGRDLCHCLCLQIVGAGVQRGRVSVHIAGLRIVVAG